MTQREAPLYAAIGFAVWLSGVVMFRLGGAVMFQSGPLILAASAIGIAGSVCMLLKATMDWRKANAADSVTIAVTMGLPGLFGDVAFIALFQPVTGLDPVAAGPAASLVLFGNACLLAFALWRARRAAGAQP